MNIKTTLIIGVAESIGTPDHMITQWQCNIKNSIRFNKDVYSSLQDINLHCAKLFKQAYISCIIIISSEALCLASLCAKFIGFLTPKL